MILALLVIVLSIFIPQITDSMYSVTNMSFSSYIIDAQIEEDGDLFIREIITVNFDEDMHVLFRDIPFQKNDNGDSNNQSAFDESSVTVKITNSRGVIYDNANAINTENVRIGYSWLNQYDELGNPVACPSGYGNDCESIFTYVPQGVSPSTTYEFTYRIQGAVSTYSDVAELNWSFYNPSESMRIENVVVNLHYPSSILDTDSIAFYGHGSKHGVLDSIDTTKVVFRYNRLGASDIIEMRLLLPSDVITSPRTGTFQPVAKKDYFLELEANIVRQDRLFYYGDFVGFALVVVFILCLIITAIRMYNKYDRELIPQFDGEYYRELPANYPPAEMGYLYHFKAVSNHDLNATFMDLIRKGYISVDYQNQSTVDEDADYTFILNKTMDRSILRSYEDFLLHWFFETIAGQDGVLKASDLEKYSKSVQHAQKYIADNVTWTNLLKKEANKNDFFDNNSEKVLSFNKTKILLGYILGFLGGFIALGFQSKWLLFGCGLLSGTTIFLTSYFYHIKRRSVQGNEEYVKWRAFKKFLSEFSHFDDYSVPSIVVWEHYLVYAVAFGIADLVNQQLKIKYGDNPPKDYTTGSYRRYSYMPLYMGSRFNQYKMNATQTIAKTQSGGKGGRGGFGGGRSFGGGGGGFRGR